MALRGIQDGLFETLRDAPEVRISTGTASTLKAVSQVVALAHATIAANYTLTLPSVSDAKGCMVIIRMDTRDGSYSVTVQDQDDSRGWSDRSLNAADESTILISDGEKWHKLTDVGV